MKYIYSTRSCFSEEAIFSVINEKEKEVFKWRSRCEELEKIVQLQQVNLAIINQYGIIIMMSMKKRLIHIIYEYQIIDF